MSNEALCRLGMMAALQLCGGERLDAESYKAVVYML